MLRALRRRGLHRPDVGRDPQVPAGRLASVVGRHVGVELGHRQLPRLGIRLEHAEVGHHAGHAHSSPPAHIGRLADAREEVEPLDERARRLPEHDERLPAPRGDLRGPACARQPHFRPLVVADDRAVQIPVRVDLGRAQKAYVDPSALKPVAEDLGHGDHGIRRLGELAVADREREMLRLRPDRTALVDQDAVGRVRRPGEVGCAARKPDANEADSAVGEPACCRHRHHLFGGIRHGVRHTTDASRASSTWPCIHSRKRSRSRLISSQRT